MRGRRRGLRSGDGGAYLLAMTVLLAVTGLGLAVSRVGQLERRLGSAAGERMQALYAADSGLAVAVARLLDGRPAAPTDLVFGASAVGGAVRVSRAKVSAPGLVDVDPCRSCASEEAEWVRASFALASTGERELRWAPGGAGGSRIVSRVAVEATVTLQPWPAGGLPAGSDDSELIPAPGCSPDAYGRAYLSVAEEVHPADCRLAALSFDVPATDPATGAICVVRMPVCVRMSDWRELR